jgi:endonuclease/exonuclease/phosphatase family metal-dependent hydrolase
VVNVRVGTYDEWVADRTWTGRTLSDHVPVVVDLAFRA